MALAIKPCTLPWLDQLALLIVLALATLVVGRTDAKLLTVCFGAPSAIGLYYLLSRLFRVFHEGFGQLAGALCF